LDEFDLILELGFDDEVEEFIEDLAPHCVMVGEEVEEDF
jgi:superfamily II DNA/RNA helicase